MSYQGSGLNGADGLGLRLGIPKSLKKGIKKLGKNVKKVVRSPIFKGAVIGAAAGAVYQKIRGRKKAARVPTIPQVGVVPIMPSRPPSSPVPYIEPPNIPMSPAGVPLPASSGGPSSGGPSMAVRQQIANKIMAAIPLSATEMAIVQAGWLGQGMKLAAEAAYGEDAYNYVPGAGQPLPNVLVEGKQDNTVLYAGLGLAALLLLGQPQRQRRSA